MSDAPKNRLSKVLSDLSAKLERLKKPDAENVRKAFESQVTIASDAEGKCDGVKLLAGLRKVIDAAPEGPAQDALDAVVERLQEERNYRGDDWCRVALLGALRELVKAFAG